MNHVPATTFPKIADAAITPPKLMFALAIRKPRRARFIPAQVADQFTNHALVDLAQPAEELRHLGERAPVSPDVRLFESGLFNFGGFELCAHGAGEQATGDRLHEVVNFRVELGQQLPAGGQILRAVWASGEHLLIQACAAVWAELRRLATHSNRQYGQDNCRGDQKFGDGLNRITKFVGPKPSTLDPIASQYRRLM